MLTPDDTKVLYAYVALITDNGSRKLSLWEIQDILLEQFNFKATKREIYQTYFGDIHVDLRLQMKNLDIRYD